MGTRFGVALVLAVWACVYMTVRPVYAYLDPGTGSFLFQIIIGAVVGAGFLLKVYWKKIAGFFIKGKVDKDEDDGLEG